METVALAVLALAGVAVAAASTVAAVRATRADHELRNGTSHRLSALETRMGRLEKRMDKLINTVLDWKNKE